MATPKSEAEGVGSVEHFLLIKSPPSLHVSGQTSFPIPTDPAWLWPSVCALHRLGSSTFQTNHWASVARAFFTTDMPTDREAEKTAPGRVKTDLLRAVSHSAVISCPRSQKASCRPEVLLRHPSPDAQRSSTLEPEKPRQGNCPVTGLPWPCTQRGPSLPQPASLSPGEALDPQLPTDQLLGPQVVPP